MAEDNLPHFVVAQMQRIAENEGFIEGYAIKHKPGAKVGDGLTSTLLSIKIVGYRQTGPNVKPEPHELALVCKVQPFSVVRKESFNTKLLFQREVYVYNTLLPALDEFQAEHKVARTVGFFSFPKSYAAFHDDSSDESIIVLEDLRQSGYRMWDKKKPTDFQSVRLVMEQLGRLHGLSIAFRCQRPDVFKEFAELPKLFIDLLTAPGMASIIQSSYANAISLMDNPEDIETLEKLAKNVNKIFADGLDAEKLGQYGVISHGDCWITNIMFQLKEVRVFQ